VKKRTKFFVNTTQNEGTRKSFSLSFESLILLEQGHQPGRGALVDAVPHVKVLARAVGLGFALYPLGAGLLVVKEVFLGERKSTVEVEFFFS